MAKRKAARTPSGPRRRPLRNGCSGAGRPAKASGGRKAGRRKTGPSKKRPAKGPAPKRTGHGKTFQEIGQTRTRPRVAIRQRRQDGRRRRKPAKKQPPRQEGCDPACCPGRWKAPGCSSPAQSHRVWTASGASSATRTSRPGTPPSSLDLDRTASAVRTGRRVLKDRFEEHTETSPALTAGDVDADWESAYSRRRRGARRRQPHAGPGHRRRHRQGRGRRVPGQRGAQGRGKDHQAGSKPLGARPGLVGRLGRSLVW